MRPHLESSRVPDNLSPFDTNCILKEADHCMFSLSYHQDSPYLATMTRHDTEFISSFKKPKRLKKLRWFMLPSESLFLQYFPQNIKSPRPFTPLQFKKHDDNCPLHFNGKNNSKCLKNARVNTIVANWRKGSVPYQLYRDFNKRRNSEIESDRIHEVAMPNFYTIQNNQSSNSSTSGYDDDT